MTQNLLLDTCALLRSVDPGPKGERTRAILADARATNRPIHVSPVSAQELGQLMRRGRLALALPLRQWFAVILSRPGVSVTDLSIDVMIASNELPDHFHNDPADRLLVATACEKGLRLVTSDRAILAYAQRGHVMALAC